MNCHICNRETEFTCDVCEEPVCDDCCVPITIHNQIDYPLCKTCNEGHEAARYECARQKNLGEEVAKAKKDARNAEARARYWKPENVAKRKAAKVERKKQREALRRAYAEEVAQVMASMFRGL